MAATSLSLAQPGYKEHGPHHALTPVSLKSPGTGMPFPATCTRRKAQPFVKKPQALFLIQIIYVDLVV